MSRRTRIVSARSAALLAALLAILLAVLLLVLNHLDWNRAKPWLNARISEALGRSFVIGGNLSLSWEKQAAAPDSGWRGMIPWPHLVAQDIHIGNPPALIDVTREMASARQLDFSLNPLALLNKTIIIPSLRFEAPAVTLIRHADAQDNWHFKNNDPSSAWKLQLQQVVFAKGQLRWRDAIHHADLTAQIDTLDGQSAQSAQSVQSAQSGQPGPANASGPAAYGMSWQLQGIYNKEAVTGNGKAGAVLSLQQQTTPYPLMANLRMGKTLLALEGTLTNPINLAALDLRLKASGASVARLYGFAGILLPETPPFAIEGHLSLSLPPEGVRWEYDKFNGKIGSSDIHGSLKYQSGPIRGRLSGTVVSQVLTFDDLAPLIGADSNAAKIEREEATRQPASKVLPVETFKTERWTSVDADIAFRADKIIRKKTLPINKLSANLHMNDGVIALTPLAFDMAGGSLNANITLDGNTVKNSVKASLKVTARHLKLKQLFPTLEALRASVGEINGDAALSGVGNSVGGLLGSANGEVKTLVNQGTVSKLLLEEMGLNIGNVLVTRLLGDKQVKLHCMVSDFGVSHGVMQTRNFVVDTDDAVLDVTGKIDLAQEQLDLTIKPDSKGLRVFSLRAPIYVRGSFKQPDVALDKGVMAMRAGGAIALATLTPFAALIPLVKIGPGENHPCAGLLADRRGKVK